MQWLRRMLRRRALPGCAGFPASAARRVQSLAMGWRCTALPLRHGAKSGALSALAAAMGAWHDAPARVALDRRRYRVRCEESGRRTLMRVLRGAEMNWNGIAAVILL